MLKSGMTGQADSFLKFYSVTIAATVPMQPGAANNIQILPKKQRGSLFLRMKLKIFVSHFNLTDKQHKER